MPGLTMLINPKAPTARKSPITSTPTPKVPAKAQQQRKTSVSQAVPKTQQQRKNSNAQASPKVVVQQQRKSSAVKPPAMVEDKRKIKAEVRWESGMLSESKLTILQGISPTMVNLQVKPVGADKRTAQPETRNETPPKKQKIEEMKTEVRDTEYQSDCMLTLSQIVKDATVMTLSRPTSTAPDTQVAPALQPANSQSTQMMKNLLRHVLHEQPSLLPFNLSIPITSTHIDNIAHTMWQIAFKHVVMLQRACQYSAMFSPIKLAALAKLNFLPSWWFFRDLVVGGLPELIKGVDGKGEEMGKAVVIDDREMQGAWNEAIKWCGSVVARRERVATPVVTEEEREKWEVVQVAQEEELMLDSKMEDAGEDEGEGE
ncbi:hypothetical protein J4E93_010024 [Alternaria ventricosa]|uniref:uncharacterized protein n=1 Tax=Alternaria ventricosa TaxID=1187951 RepID=UPI0020C423C0|nr:uncharacterized protein J4E93_010024 [Alternaria ventricosa]KAI4638470.1 hypothetical protein J4E93_010024 [Alternaria ventricosa]